MSRLETGEVNVSDSLSREVGDLGSEGLGSGKVGLSWSTSRESGLKVMVI